MFPRPEEPSINLSRLVTKCAGIHRAQTRTEPSLTLGGLLGSSQQGLHHPGFNFLSKQIKLVFRHITNSFFPTQAHPVSRVLKPYLVLEDEGQPLPGSVLLLGVSKIPSGLKWERDLGC